MTAFAMHLLYVQITAFLSTHHQDTGTVAYMAPECFDPKGHVNERSDIYALGITLWECITGLKPWAGYPNHFAVVYEVRVEAHTVCMRFGIYVFVTSLVVCSALVESLRVYGHV